MKAIERRIQKLDKQVAQFPCTKPGHDSLFIFIQRFGEDKPDAETQAKIDSIHACEQCKDKLVILIMNFGEPLKPVPIDVTPSPWRRDPKAPVFTYEVERAPEMEPVIVPQEDQPVCLADWLRDLRN